MKPRSSFDLTPPNSAFTYSDLNGGKVQVISLELSNSNVISESVIVFKAQKPNQRIKAGTYSEVTIFIDGANDAGVLGSDRMGHGYLSSINTFVYRCYA